MTARVFEGRLDGAGLRVAIAAGADRPLVRLNPDTTCAGNVQSAI